MEKETLAMEMLHEIKAQSKRWFITAIVTLVILIVSNLAWLGYINQYETVTSEEITSEYSQQADTQGDNSPINQNMGE